MLDRYKTKDYDEIFCYFMDIIVLESKEGWYEVICNHKFNAQYNSMYVQGYINEMVYQIPEGLEPVVFDMEIERIYQEYITKDSDNISKYILIRNIVTNIFYDKVINFIRMVQCWSEDVRTYANKNFYPYLTGENKKEYTAYLL